MGWIYWCSFLLGGLVFWLLSWLLDWLLGRRGTARLQSQLSEAETEMGRLQADLTTARATGAKLGSVEQELRLRTEDLDGLKINFGAVTKDLDAANLKIQGLEALLGEAEGIKVQLSNLQTRFGEIQAERDRFSTELDGLRLKLGDWDKLQADYDGLRVQLASLEGERNTLSAELDKARAEYEGRIRVLEGERDQHKGEASNLAGQVASTGGLLAIIEALRARFGGAKLEEIESRIATLQGDADGARGELDELRSRFEAVQGERDRLSAELQGLQGRAGQLDSLGDEKNRLLAEIERYKNEFSGLQGRLASIESERNTLADELDRHKDESSDLSAKLAAMGGNLTLLEGLRKRIGAQPEELESRFVALENERNSYTREL